MFDNPIGLAAARRQNSGAFPHKRADEIWDAVCALGAYGEEFSPSEVATLLIKETHRHLTYATVLTYVRAFLAYCLAAPDEDFSGPASRLVRVRTGTYKLVDMPER